MPQIEAVKKDSTAEPTSALSGSNSGDKKCCVHIAIKGRHNIDDINSKVCRDVAGETHSDGKYYCLLHLPKKEKNDN